DANGHVQPQMVDRYTVSADQRTYTLTLRDGLLWHDGKPVTSDDCIASIKRWGAKDAMGQKLMTFVKGFEVVDARTFRIVLNEPTGLVLSGLGKPSSSVPFMMPKRVADTPPDRQINDYLHRRLSRHDLEEIHDAAVKAAIKDQETAGVDIVSDGELRRDNMIDHFAMRLPGVQIDHTSKRFYYDFYDSVVRARMPTASLGLGDDFRFLRRFTDRRAKVSVTGPHSLVKRIRNEHYPTEEAFALDIARVMNLE